MAPQKRQSDTTLEDRLFKEFYNFSFYKAVSLLESLLPEKKSLGETLVPADEAVRFSVKPGLSFPPSDISNLEPGIEGGAAKMEVAFMGLIGPSGVLPHWYNELAMERLRKKDSSIPAFYDVFHHRLISLFYLAWKKNRFTENYRSGAQDRLSSYLLSLIGLGTPGLTELIGLPEESLIFYSGLLARPVSSAVSIEATVGYLAGTDVKVDQFIERAIEISREDQTQIGLANGKLGVDAVCGSLAMECRTKFRVNLGPMGYDDFLRFLPVGDMLAPIFSLVRYMVGMEYEFEIRVFLKREEVPPAVLGGKTSTSPRLGWSAWIKTPGMVHQDDPSITFQEN